MKTRIQITHIVAMGDSLTDLGTLNKRHLLGAIPLSYIVGLSKSPKGCFTNGTTYVGDYAAMLVSRLFAEDLKRNNQIDDTALSDDVIVKGQEHRELQKAYSLENDKVIKYKETDFFRIYAEGGLTASDYSHSWTFSFSSMFAREMVSTLAAKRKELLHDDTKRMRSMDEKEKTLIVEWSGANDLLMVNSRPSKEIVDNAINARIENVKELMKHGYQHFVLNALPDFSFSPRYQAMSTSEQKNAHDCCSYFNDQLRKACKKLQEEFAEISIDVFEADVYFKDVYDHSDSAEYSFDPEKRKQPFINSKDFNLKDHISKGLDYMFWDDIHPSARLHEILAKKFYDKYSKQFDIEVPNLKPISSAQYLYETFVASYKGKWKQDKEGYFGNWRYSSVLDKLKNSGVGFVTEDDYEEDYKSELAIILDHAINQCGARSRQVLIELHWIDENNKINANIPVLLQCEKRMGEGLDEKRSLKRG